MKEQKYVLEEHLETTLESGEVVQLQRIATRVVLLGSHEQPFGLVNRYRIIAGPHKGGVVVTQQGSYVDRCFG
ncbi:MAG TPA: hypothetical protein VJ246_00310 [Patescibacteria group bacterium]|nr:hypothetical protein [Patescibacteria group bacterium]